MHHTFNSVFFLLLPLLFGLFATVTLSSATPAINCILKYSADESTSPPVLASIAELRTLPGPDISAMIQKVTNHSSSVPWEEILPTLKSIKPMKCEVNLVPGDTTHQALMSMMVTQPSPRRRFYMYLPDTTLIFACKGYITNLNIGPMNVDGVALASFEISFTSIPSLNGSTAW